MISENDYYHPKEALNRICEQESQLLTAIDTQTILQILLANNITTVDEINEMRQKVSNLPKYKVTLENLQKERKAMEHAIAHPDDYLKAIFNAKMNGDL